MFLTNFKITKNLVVLKVKPSFSLNYEALRSYINRNVSAKFELLVALDGLR